MSGYHPPLGTSAISGVIFCGVGYQHNFCHKMCADKYPTATEKVKIIFDMHQSHGAEKRRGWVATSHPLVAEGYSGTAVPACDGQFSTSHEHTVHTDRLLYTESNKVRRIAVHDVAEHAGCNLPITSH